MTGNTRRKPRRLYIAGPYSAGDPMANIRRALEAADEALARGWLPFVPHLSGFWHFHSPKPWEDWVRMDLAWLEVCDALLRLAGESPGADIEVKYARELGLPVYAGLADLPVADEPGASEESDGLGEPGG